MSFKTLANMSEPRDKARVISAVGALQGWCRIEACQHRPRRTDRQNRFYWPCFVEPFAAWLREEWGDNSIDEDDAHFKLKEQFLTVTQTSRTGKRLKRVRSTTKLDTREFNEYLDQCAQFLAQWCCIVVPEPGVYREQEQPAHALNGAPAD